MVRELAQSYVGVDPVHEPIPVRPVVHYTMGGIHTDIDTATPLPGLFAAGECACVSINGANRLGSNSLAEILVFGARAGRSAAAFAKANPLGRASAARCKREAAQARIRALFMREGGSETVVAACARRCTTPWKAAPASIAARHRCEETCRMLAELRAATTRCSWKTAATCSTPICIQVLELGSMLDVAEAMAHSALQRSESRGSHQRLDHPERDDDKLPQAQPRDLSRRRSAGDQLLRRGDHPLAAGRAGLWGASRMSDTITLEVLRYHPETDSEPHFQSYTVPYQRGLGGARCAQSHQGPPRRHAVLPLVLPHGGLRQLRHDDQRRAEAVLPRLSARLSQRRRSGSSRSTTSRSSAIW